MPHIAAHKARVTFLGVSPFWFEPSTVADVRTELKLGHDCRLLLTAARITPRKGHHWVLEGLRLLPDAIKQTLTYVVAGVVKDQDYHRRLRELAARCGVPVVFTGPVSRDQLRALYDAASLLCMPGDPSPEVVEGLGLAYLEAAARGLPSIAGRLGGIPEAVLHDETGLLLERFDGRAVADALYALLTDDERRERLARAAAARAGRLSWEACARLSYE